MKYLKWLLILIVLFLFFLGCLIQIDSKYQDRLYDLEKDNQNYKAMLKEKNNLIKSYVNKLKEKCEECNCDWYQDFYYEFADEVGAYE